MDVGSVWEIYDCIRIGGLLILFFMARQAGDIRITGSFDGFCFYKMDGEYYIRHESSLTGKRFWKDKAFEGSRRSCSRFGTGNRLASRVYALLTREQQAKGLFARLRSMAIALLKQGQPEEAVMLALQALLPTQSTTSLTQNKCLRRPKRKVKNSKRRPRSACPSVFVLPDLRYIRSSIPVQPLALGPPG